MEMSERQKELASRLHDHFLKQLNTQIITWDDMFSYLRDAHNQYCHCNCPVHMTYTMALSRAFIVAMEELPNEGDIVAICAHMADLLFFYAVEKLGIGGFGNMMRGLPEDEVEDMLDALMQRSGKQGVEMLSADTPAFSRSGKKVLH